MSWGGTGAMAGTTTCGLVTEMLVDLLLCVPVPAARAAHLSSRASLPRGAREPGAVAAAQ